MTANTQLKNNIMRKVYMAFWARKLSSSLAVKTYALIAFVGIMAIQVSMKNVFLNMPNTFDIAAIWRFSASAFANTELIVQALAVGAIASIVFVAKELMKNTFHQHSGLIGTSA